MIGLEGRHPSTVAAARWFQWSHLPAGKPRNISMEIASLAQSMIVSLPDGNELTAGLRKLREAKDCLVFHAIDSARDPGA